MDIDVIAKQCMDAVIAATVKVGDVFDDKEDSRFTARGPGSVGEPCCKLQPLF